MTFREKFEKDHPTDSLNLMNYCPEDFGYEEKYDCDKELSCNECWEREIPGTERMEKMKEKKMKTIVTVREPESCNKITFEYNDIYEATNLMQECARKGKVVELEMRECNDSTDNH